MTNFALIRSTDNRDLNEVERGDIARIDALRHRIEQLEQKLKDETKLRKKCQEMMIEQAKILKRLAEQKGRTYVR